jgi:hypothetical protein
MEGIISYSQICKSLLFEITNALNTLAKTLFYVQNQIGSLAVIVL